MIVLCGEWYFRVELLEKARAAHPHGLLVCDCCGFAWLTMETAKIGVFGNPSCLDEFDCYRRSQMNMARPRKLTKRERMVV